MGISAEIWDIVIDHLHDDRQSLARCGNVCWMLLHACRYHLFSRVAISSRHYDAKGKSRRHIPTTVIANYAQELEIGFGTTRSQWTRMKLWNIPIMRKLRTFRLVIVDLDEMDERTHKWMLEFLPQVEALFIYRGRTAKAKDMIAFISSASSLKSLKVQQCTVDNSSLAFDTMSQYPLPPIKHIVLHGGKNIDWISGWIRSSDEIAMESLELHYLQASEMPSVSRALLHFGPYLTHLKICFNTHSEPISSEFEIR